MTDTSSNSILPSSTPSSSISCLVREEQENKDHISQNPPEIVFSPTQKIPTKKMYFDNNTVEHLLTQYKWTGCTDVGLRNKIMDHATDLLRAVILHNSFNLIYGQDQTSLNELVQVGWIQIEKTLYKYKARAHCTSCLKSHGPEKSALKTPKSTDYTIPSPKDIIQQDLKCPTCKQIPAQITYRGLNKLFNMWTGVAYKSVLAFIKQHTKDGFRSKPLRENLRSKTTIDSSTGIIDAKAMLANFWIELDIICQDNTDYLAIAHALRYISESNLYDSKQSICGKQMIARKSGRSLKKVSNFFEYIRSREEDFEHSPVSRAIVQTSYLKHLSA